MAYLIFKRVYVKELRLRGLKCVQPAGAKFIRTYKCEKL